MFLSICIAHYFYAIGITGAIKYGTVIISDTVYHFLQVMFDNYILLGL